MIHSFDVAFAEKYGVNAAIIFQHLAYWIKHNEANGVNYYDGNYWTYNSVKAFTEIFPYMSRRQIETAMQKLIEAGLVIRGNHNKASYDRTLWYAFTQNGKSISHFGEMDLHEMGNGLQQNVKPIPDIIPDIIPDNNTNICVAKPQKHKHGEYQHVLLTDEEYQKLVSDFGEQTVEYYIKKVDEYCEQSGKRYKNYNLAIRNTFMKNDRGVQKPKSDIPTDADYDW